jgi:hypothetical protein
MKVFVRIPLDEDGHIVHEGHPDFPSPVPGPVPVPDPSLTIQVAVTHGTDPGKTTCVWVCQGGVWIALCKDKEARV